MDVEYRGATSSAACGAATLGWVFDGEGGFRAFLNGRARVVAPVMGTMPRRDARKKLDV